MRPDWSRDEMRDRARDEWRRHAHDEWHRGHPWHRANWRRRRGHRLQSRLFLWFLGAIALAVALSGLTVSLTRPESTEGPAKIVARTIATRLAYEWDDRAACDAYVARVHDDTGIALRLVRDPLMIPQHVRHRITNGSASFDGAGDTYVPILRGGALVGAIEIDTHFTGAQPWRFFAAMGVGLFVLAAAARRVSRRLARPLESVASAAERFGAGDLQSRTGLGTWRAHWVAAEVKDVAFAFDTMAARIEGVVRDQRELLAAISHELRTPLARARIALEIARDRPESAAPSLDQIERELGDVDAILGDLLAAARAGLSDLRREEGDVAAWLRAKIISERTPPAIELIVAREAEGITASFDKALLGRALHNVFENARAHGDADAPLETRLERVEDDLQIIVRNQGAGFPLDILARAFEPFVTQSDPARTPGARADMPRGMGLGLALVRRIAEAHGGSAFARNVESEDGSVIGADVGIRIPRAARASSDPAHFAGVRTPR